ncbi:MAG TPA: hypothetical protein VG733_03445 [Chthoniobacteraceae bacterium]|nr:hypothetical protein [Chthoniobacteraceae bacterium]
MNRFTLKTIRSAFAAIALLAIAMQPGRAQAPSNQPQGQDPEGDKVLTIKDTDAVHKTASGNITQLAADAIFIKGAGDVHPTGYAVNAQTAYVDDAGAPAQRAKAAVGHAVTITYVMQGDTRLALQVLVRNAP